MEKTRRDFLKTSSLIAGGIALSPFSTYGYNSSVDDTIKIAVIGCGGRGTGAAAQALSTAQNVKLVAMADAFQDRVEQSYKNLMSKKYKNAKGQEVPASEKIDVPESRRFYGFDAYLKAIPLADVVILTASPGFRPQHFIEAVKQNKHIFAEKPLGTDAPGIRKVLAAAEEAKRKKLNVVVGLQRHYQPNYLEAIKRIHDGAIGDRKSVV